MSAQHTPGRLFVVESQDWGRANCHLTAEIYQSSIGSVWVNGTSQNRADARRLAACWNACEGLPTDLLENITLMGDTLASRFKLRDEAERELTAQRDELLEALKDCLAKGSRWHPCDPVVVKAKAAIAKAIG